MSLDKNRPKAPSIRQDILTHCWSEEEARKFLQAAHSLGTQPAAFYALALDTGARKGELCGLRWQNVDLEARTVKIVEQLVKPGIPPLFGPPKNGQLRPIHIAEQTASLLRRHRAAQAETKLKNRKHYRDYGLVFAKDWEQMKRKADTLGGPLQMNNIGQREFKDLIKSAEVPAIKFHGLRHTCATLLLKAGIPVHVVSERLGHKGVDITMNIYAHVLPSMQEEAAASLESALFRRGDSRQF